jgi:parallel beta-helix repeat protein
MQLRRRFLTTAVKAAGLYSTLPIAGLVATGASTAIAAPAIPSTQVVNVKSFGAKGDGKTVDSPAINAAIEAAARLGGGTVYFPTGIYLSASIRLKSNIALYLENGAVIEAVDWTIAKYDLPEPNEAAGNYQDFGHSHWQNSLIWGIGLENVSIVGSGLIHGKGLNCGFNRFAGETDGKKYKDGGPGEGNKAIALRECRNVVLRDFSILHGGHFGILATGVSNMLIDNLKIDTNRDGMDIDACNNVRITNCTVNSPWDDGICLKASYGLAKVWHCENITISDCYVCGSYDEGSVLDGTFKRSSPEYKSYTTGRIKLGTESNGDFRNIAITNCVFDGCRGLALESVDGSHIEDITISNITMRDVANDPIFIRLGARLRGPNNPPVGSIKRVNISNIVVHNADGWFASTITGLPDHPVEDISLSNLQIETRGGGRKDQRDLVPPENPAKYPEPGMFGEVPAYGFFLRHVKGITMDHVKTAYIKPEARYAMVLEDIQDAYFTSLNLQQGNEDAPYFELRNVTDFSIKDVRHLKDKKINKFTKRLEI